MNKKFQQDQGQNKSVYALINEIRKRGLYSKSLYNLRDYQQNQNFFIESDFPFDYDNDYINECQDDIDDQNSQNIEDIQAAVSCATSNYTQFPLTINQSKRALQNFLRTNLGRLEGEGNLISIEVCLPEIRKIMYTKQIQDPKQYSEKNQAGFKRKSNQYQIFEQQEQSEEIIQDEQYKQPQKVPQKIQNKKFKDQSSQQQTEFYNQETHLKFLSDIQAKEVYSSSQKFNCFKICMEYLSHEFLHVGAMALLSGLIQKDDNWKVRGLFIRNSEKQIFSIAGSYYVKEFHKFKLMELKYFAINIKYRQKGLGKYLAKILFNSARLSDIKLIICRSDTQAIEFWKKLGFQQKIPKDAQKFVVQQILEYQISGGKFLYMNIDQGVNYMFNEHFEQVFSQNAFEQMDSFLDKVKFK